jgi:hypothetical protein
MLWLAKMPRVLRSWVPPFIRAKPGLAKTFEESFLRRWNSHFLQYSDEASLASTGFGAWEIFQGDE